MMNYFEFFKRLLTFKKYPLFRTVPFRYLVLNILIISLLISLPAVVSLLITLNVTTGLSDDEIEIPEFVIEDGVYQGENDVIEVNDSKVLFTEDVSRDDIPALDDDVLIGFLRDGIYISGFQGDGFSYALLDDVNDDEALDTFVNQQLTSIYFYIFIYFLFYLTLIYFIVFTVMLIAALTMSRIAVWIKKRTDYINWFKFASYATVPAIIPIIALSLAVDHTAWYLYLLTVPFYYYYYKKLPPLKKKKKQVNQAK